MYMGNGVTKIFPIPSGYDGSTVILKFPNGKGIQAIQGESYTIRDGKVCFLVAIPSGVEICFSSSDVLGLVDKEITSYVVVYPDGVIHEVKEDPAILLEEARKTLANTQNQLAELRAFVNDTKTYLSSVVSTTQSDLNGRLESYKRLADLSVSEMAMRVKREIIDDWLPAYNALEDRRKSIMSDTEKLDKLKDDFKKLVMAASDEAVKEVQEYCLEVKAIYETIKNYKPSLQSAVSEAQNQVKQTGYETKTEIRYLMMKEAEEIKNLRIKLEATFSQLDAQLNTRWDIIRRLLNEQQ